MQDSGYRSFTSVLAAVVTSVSSSDLWHSRLGHPFHSKLQLLKQHVHDVNMNKTASCCDICHLKKKKKKLPFTASTNVSNNPFDLLHCDLWGPFATSTVDSFKFFLTIVDDFTKCTWVYLLKHKSETQVYLPQFASMMSTQFNFQIKTIRSDNGIKFYLKDFFQSNGILHQLTCVDTPQQNAVVERKHQHILNGARALRFQSQLPLCFWGDCKSICVCLSLLMNVVVVLQLIHYHCHHTLLL